MRFSLKKALAGAAVVAAVATVMPALAPTAASAATPATLGAGTPGISPAGTTASPNTTGTVFNVNLPTGAACPGDTNGSAGGGVNYVFNTFFVPKNVSGKTPYDLSTLVFGSNGAVGPGTPTTANARNTLPTSTGSLARNNATDPAIAPATTGNITLPISGTAGFSFQGLGASWLPAGTYNVGVACNSDNTTNSVTYWAAPITVLSNDGTNITWVAGEAPAAPVVNAPGTGGSANGNGQITVDLQASPGATSYQIYVNGTPNGAPITGTAGFDPAPVTIGSLTNGTTYNVTATASNSVGSSAQSSPAVAFNPSFPAQPAVRNLSASGTGGNLAITWQVPDPALISAGTAVANYDVTVTPSGGGAPAFTQTGVTTTSANATGLTVGASYTCAVTTNYTNGYPSATATVPCVSNSATTLNQVITVTRPVGALVLTQVCGRYGSLDPEGAQLGFPSGLTTFGTAVNDGNTGQLPTDPAPSLGIAPYLSQAAVPFSGNGTLSTQPNSTPGNPNQVTQNSNAAAGSAAVAGGAQDTAQFGSYPYPDDANGVATPTYPTFCGVEFGAAKFVDGGAQTYGRGQFYAAEARLNQVTVVDTRDSDQGWNIAADVTDFKTPDNARSFSANQLGWTPKVNRVTASFTDANGVTYSQQAYPGASVAQNTLNTAAAPGGLRQDGAKNTLIFANPRTAVAGQANTFYGGLGIAVADARLKLAIPVTAIAGNYTAVMTITSI